MSDKLKKLSQVCKAIGNEQRVKMIDLLLVSARQGLAVNELAEKINLSIKSTSKHLQILDNAGILNRKRFHNYTLYSVNVDSKKIFLYLKNILN